MTLIITGQSPSVKRYNLCHSAMGTGAEVAVYEGSTSQTTAGAPRFFDPG
ncbi:MAG: hypothetical protein LBH56_03550 [Coriobacteriales bacterium]|nr:hypothetical protein [Coriobacteriales bacterium]